MEKIQSMGIKLGTQDGFLNLTEASLSKIICHEPISNFFDVENTPFARGKFAAVRRAKCLRTGKYYAAKVLRKRRRACDVRHEALHEAAVLMLAKDKLCDKIIELHQVFESRAEMTLILQLASGGELQRVIDEEEKIEESFARQYLIHVLIALRFLHQHDIAHLDLKPQNMLLTASHPSSDLKLCDFGISRFLQKNVDVKEICGTPDYVAPEILQYEPISLATDMWSVGVLTYVLLTGLSPFGGDTKQETFMNITKGDPVYDREHFGEISSDAVDFISKLLVLEAGDRMSVEECLSHSWLCRSSITRKLSVISSNNIDESNDENKVQKEKPESGNSFIDNSSKVAIGKVDSNVISIESNCSQIPIDEDHYSSIHMKNDFSRIPIEKDNSISNICIGNNSSTITREKNNSNSIYIESNFNRFDSCRISIVTYDSDRISMETVNNSNKIYVNNSDRITMETINNSNKIYDDDSSRTPMETAKNSHKIYEEKNISNKSGIADSVIDVRQSAEKMQHNMSPRKIESSFSHEQINEPYGQTNNSHGQFSSSNDQSDNSKNPCEQTNSHEQFNRAHGQSNSLEHSSYPHGHSKFVVSISSEPEMELSTSVESGFNLSLKRANSPTLVVSNKENDRNSLNSPGTISPPSKRECRDVDDSISLFKTDHSSQITKGKNDESNGIKPRISSNFGSRRSLRTSRTVSNAELQSQSLGQHSRLFKQPTSISASPRNSPSPSSLSPKQLRSTKVILSAPNSPNLHYPTNREKGRVSRQIKNIELKIKDDISCTDSSSRSVPYAFRRNPLYKSCCYSKDSKKWRSREHFSDGNLSHLVTDRSSSLPKEVSRQTFTNVTPFFPAEKITVRVNTTSLENVTENIGKNTSVKCKTSTSGLNSTGTATFALPFKCKSSTSSLHSTETATSVLPYKCKSSTSSLNSSETATSTLPYNLRRNSLNKSLGSVDLKRNEKPNFVVRQTLRLSSLRIKKNEKKNCGPLASFQNIISKNKNFIC